MAKKSRGLNSGKKLVSRRNKSLWMDKWFVKKHLGFAAKADPLEGSAQASAIVLQKVQVEEYPDGSVLLTPVEVISRFELKLLKDQLFQKRLIEFDQWESNNHPAETDLDHLEKSSED
jgi:hypothetical protein